MLLTEVFSDLSLFLILLSLRKNKSGVEQSIPTLGCHFLLRIASSRPVGIRNYNIMRRNCKDRQKNYTCGFQIFINKRVTIGGLFYCKTDQMLIRKIENQSQNTIGNNHQKDRRHNRRCCRFTDSDRTALSVKTEIGTGYYNK